MKERNITHTLKMKMNKRDEQIMNGGKEDHQQTKDKIKSGCDREEIDNSHTRGQNKEGNDWEINGREEDDLHPKGEDEKQ